ncbi:MAG: hypothetical protein NT051_01990 [Candidatus Micrarchaeota archaeon]|nr:hypothetical protein [Candidatus Micrarchaeota archaeon]
MSNRAFIKEQKRDYRNKAIGELSEFRKHYIEFGQYARKFEAREHMPQYKTHEIKQEAQSMVKQYANKRDTKILVVPLVGLQASQSTQLQ